jgi:hypothetical protein
MKGLRAAIPSTRDSVALSPQRQWRTAQVCTPGIAGMAGD